MTYNYRKIAPDDAPNCVEILRDWIKETTWMPTLHTRASMERFWKTRLTQVAGWVAIEDDQIIGFCVRDQSVITALYLTKKARGRGVGRELLELAKAGSNELSLWVFEANRQAQEFYRREGFEEVVRTDGDNEEGLPDINLLWRCPIS